MSNMNFPFVSYENKILKIKCFSCGIVEEIKPTKYIIPATVKVDGFVYYEYALPVLWHYITIEGIYKRICGDCFRIKDIIE